MNLREEVTRAAIKAIIANRRVCPSCGEKVLRNAKALPGETAEHFHAEDCIELRADLADGIW